MRIQYKSLIILSRTSTHLGSSERITTVYDMQSVRDHVLDACPELNRRDAPITRTNSLETIRNMVASGLGVSVLPRDALTAAADEGTLATCEGCFLDEDLGNGVSRVRVSATGNVTAGGLTLTTTSTRRLRWDLYLY